MITMEYKGVPKGNPYWALILGFSVAVAALLFGLWLIRPTELRKLMHQQRQAAPVIEETNVPVPPTTAPLPPEMVVE